AEKSRNKGRQVVKDREPRDKPNSRKAKLKRKHGTSEPAVRFHADIPYIHDLTQQELLDTKGKVLLLDPGRRDVFHGIHENSTPENPMRYRLTQQQLISQRRTRRFQKILLKAKRSSTLGNVQSAEDFLATASNRTLDPTEFDMYIVKRSMVWDIL
ncbi:hypothetical protein LPJ53_006563, partial [Coemansia erecta]